MAIKNLDVISIPFKNNIVFQTESGKSIKGKVNEKNIPCPCRVRLFERRSALLISEVATDNLGNYEFQNLNNEERFFVVAHHPKLLYNAVIQDNVEPK